MMLHIADTDSLSHEFLTQNLLIKKYLMSLRGDSALHRSAISKESIDLTITSPPYNLGISYASHTDDMTYAQYLAFCKIWLSNCLIWSKSSGRLCLNVPLDQNKYGRRSIGADLNQLAQEVGWSYQTTIIWNEQNISKRTAWGSWRSASAPYVITPVELIIVFYKNDWKKPHKGISDLTKEEFIQWTNGMWTFPGESKKRIGHPAPFPRELAKRCIKLFSYVGDMILDPFVGSGTTMIEAINHHRFALGLDIEPSYIELALKRIKKECHLWQNEEFIEFFILPKINE